MGLAANDLRYDILEPNNILVADGTMDERAWSSLAFSLGIQAKSGQRSNQSTHRLAQKMKKRKVHSAAQTYDAMKPFIDSLVSASPKLSQQNRCVYHGDAVPTLDALKNTVNRLPTPKPAISIGYQRGAFSVSHDELHNGIIAGPSGEPCDLNHVSQPISDHYWPFFVVEISENSMEAARNASAVTAATCNNAVSLLASAAAHDGRDWTSNYFMFDPKFARSFSLSIYDKTAVLSTHGAEGLAPHVASQIAVYQLDNGDDVSALADRVHGIMVWANYNRLGEIIATLDQLDKKVHGNLSGLTLSGEGYDFDPHCLKTLKLQPAKRQSGRVRVVVKAGLPSWLSR